MKNNWKMCLFFTLSLTCMSVVAEPASKESVRALMNKTGAGDVGKQMLKQMIPALKQMIPDAPEKFWTDVMAETNANEMIELVIPVYQKHLNAQDIKQLNAFYDSPVGKKLVSAQPAIMQETMMLGQKWGQQTAGNVLEKYKSQSDINIIKAR